MASSTVDGVGCGVASAAQAGELLAKEKTTLRDVSIGEFGSHICGGKSPS